MPDPVLTPNCNCCQGIVIPCGDSPCPSRAAPAKVRITFVNVNGLDIFYRSPVIYPPGDPFDGFYFIRNQVTGAGTDWNYPWQNGVDEAIPAEGRFIFGELDPSNLVTGLCLVTPTVHCWVINLYNNTAPNTGPFNLSSSGFHYRCCSGDSQGFFFYGEYNGTRVGGTSLNIMEPDTGLSVSDCDYYFSDQDIDATPLTQLASCDGPPSSYGIAWRARTLAFNCDPFYVEMVFSYTFPATGCGIFSGVTVSYKIIVTEEP